MFLQNTIRKISNIYHEYPRTFWNVVVITFIDHIGGALIFPFFALYLTSKFGRKGIIIFGLFASSFSALAMSFATTFQSSAGLVVVPIPAEAI